MTCSTATRASCRASASPASRDSAAASAAARSAPWGETIIKQFVHEAVDEALKLEAALARLRTHAADRAAALLADPADGRGRAARDLSVPRLEPARGADRPLSGVARLPRPRAPRPARRARPRTACPSTTCRCRCSRARSPIVRRFASSRCPLDRRRRPATQPTPAADPRAGAPPTPSRPEDAMETSTARAIHDPAADFYIDALREAAGHRDSVPGRRRLRVLALFARAARHQGHRRVRQARGLPAGARGVRATRLSRPRCRFRTGSERSTRGEHFMDVIFNSGNGVARVDDLWFDHAPRTNVLGRHRAAVAGRGDDLVEGVHPGARALRRRRRAAPAARNRSVARLAASADALRRLLARAAQPPDPVRVRLSRQAAEHAGVGDGRADAAAERQPAEPAERRLLRHAAVARAVPARHRALEVSRRPRAAGRAR